MHMTLRPSADFTVQQMNVHYSQYMHCVDMVVEARAEPPPAAIATRSFVNSQLDTEKKQ